MSYPSTLGPRHVTDSQESLQLKSAALHDATSNAQASANAVLCTPNNTYQIRQVQSSNSVFILKPGRHSVSDEGESVSETSLTAIAQCPTTLELVPSSDDSTSILAGALPVYSTNDSDQHSSARPSKPRGRHSYFADLPLSSKQLDIGWAEICAFEAEGQAWQPSEATLLAIWKAILHGASASGLDLCQKILAEELVAFAMDEGCKEELLDAILLRIGVDATGFDDQCE